MTDIIESSPASSNKLEPSQSTANKLEQSAPSTNKLKPSQSSANKVEPSPSSNVAQRKVGTDVVVIEAASASHATLSIFTFRFVT